MELLAKLFDEKIIKVLKEIQNKKRVQVREIARSTSLQPSTVHRIFKKLEKVGLLIKESIGAVHLYNVQSTSELYSLIEKILPKQTPLQMFITKVTVHQVEEILLMNSSENMSNLLVIGDMKANIAQEIADIIKKEYNHSIRLLVLSRNQYENLDALNMKPAHQQVLFKKGNNGKN